MCLSRCKNNFAIYSLTLSLIIGTPVSIKRIAFLQVTFLPVVFFPVSRVTFFPVTFLPSTRGCGSWWLWGLHSYWVWMEYRVVFICKAATKEVEKDFDSVFSRLVLCRTFRLDEDGKVLTPEEILYRVRWRHNTSLFPRAVALYICTFCRLSSQWVWRTTRRTFRWTSSFDRSSAAVLSKTLKFFKLGFLCVYGIRIVCS